MLEARVDEKRWPLLVGHPAGTEVGSAFCFPVIEGNTMATGRVVIGVERAFDKNKNGG